MDPILESTPKSAEDALNRFLGWPKRLEEQKGKRCPYGALLNFQLPEMIIKGFERIVRSDYEMHFGPIPAESDLDTKLNECVRSLNVYGVDADITSFQDCTVPYSEAVIASLEKSIRERSAEWVAPIDENSDLDLKLKEARMRINELGSKNDVKAFLTQPEFISILFGIPYPYAEADIARVVAQIRQRHVTYVGEIPAAEDREIDAQAKRIRGFVPSYAGARCSRPGKRTEIGGIGKRSPG